MTSGELEAGIGSAIDTNPDGPYADLSECPGLQLIPVSAGTFTMGSPEGEVGRGYDEDPHEVTLTTDFEIGATEVTGRCFELLMGYDPSDDGATSDHPVEQVFWHQAAAFANALSAAEGLEACFFCSGSAVDVDCATAGDPYACEGYRLPTEAEWEYAARAGEDAAFSNGGDLVDGATSCSGDDVELANGATVGEVAWFSCNAGDPQPVAQLAPNAWGLYDTAGNVWEWTWDWYGGYGGDEQDPSGASSGAARVTRGGAWRSAASTLRAASRGFSQPSGRNELLGFRVSRSVP